MEQVGEGFVGIIDDNKAIEVHQKAAAMAGVCSEDHSFGEYDIVVLDELSVAVDLGLVDAEAMLELVKNKPEALHLVITGRNARPELIEIADLVTEMKEIKHPYQKGVLAQRAMTGRECINRMLSRTKNPDSGETQAQ